jgi:RNA polymerase sigma factor (sigma-70 family)
MPDARDMALVREFARHNSEAAFTELVQRHIALVYSVARRCTGNDGDAQDVTQAVFIILARKAAGLRERTLLPGWLYETTRFTAARLLRTNVRRQTREQEAYMLSTLSEADTADVWEKLSPHLEAAMSKLAESDRALLVLRFYQNKSGPEAAALMGIREDAAHKRLSRALEKLRKFFTKRGVVLSAAVLTAAISANSVQAAPAVLAKAATAVAFAKGATASTSTLTLIKGALKVMAWTKAKTAIVIGVGVLLVAGTTTTLIVESGFKPGDLSPKKAQIMSHMQSIKMSVIPAMLQYAKEHQDEIPTRISEIKRYLPTSTPAGIDDDHWEILATGKLTPQLTRNDVILMQEKNVQAGQQKIIGYTDGHFSYKK